MPAMQAVQQVSEHVCIFLRKFRIDFGPEPILIAWFTNQMSISMENKNFF